MGPRQADFHMKMAFKQSCAFTLLLTLGVALAQDATTTTDPNSNSGMPSIPGLPNFLSGFPFFPGSNMGSGLPSIPGIPSMGSGSSGFPGLPNIPGLHNMFGGRSRRDIKPNDSENLVGEELKDYSQVDNVESQSGGHNPEHEHQDRFFFTHFPVITGCDYTVNPGRSCRSCNQALTCTSNNVGLLQTCRGLFRYCNNGRCSLTRGPACSTTTSTTSSTSTSSTSTSTSSTTTASTSTSTATPTTQAAG